MPWRAATLPRTFASPDPTYTMLRSDGATAIEPIEEIGCSSKIDFHVAPPSVDFQTPPDAMAAKYVDGSPGMPAARDTRPPAAGPMLRYLSALNSFGESRQAGLGSSCARSAIRDAAEHRNTAHNTRNREPENDMRRSLPDGPRVSGRDGTDARCAPPAGIGRSTRLSSCRCCTARPDR